MRTRWIKLQFPLNGQLVVDTDSALIIPLLQSKVNKTDEPLQRNQYVRLLLGHGGRSHEDSVRPERIVKPEEESGSNAPHSLAYLQNSCFDP